MEVARAILDECKIKAATIIECPNGHIIIKLPDKAGLKQISKIRLFNAHEKDTGYPFHIYDDNLKVEAINIWAKNIIVFR